MKINSFVSLSRSDFPDIPEDVFRAIEVLSRNLKEVNNALISRLSEDNENSEIRNIEFEHEVEKKIQLNKVRDIPVGVIHLWNEDYDFCKITWKYDGANKILVKASFDGTPTDTVKTRIKILGA